MHLHGTFIKINGPIVVMLLFFTNFLSFYRMSFFSSGILSKPHYTGLICLFSFFLVGTVSQTFPNFHGIDSVGKNKKVICSLSHHWDFTVVFFFPHDWTGIVDSWEEQEVKCHSHYIIPYQVYAINTTCCCSFELDHDRGNACQISALKWLVFSPFPYRVFWKEVVMCSPHLWSGELCPIPLRVEQPCNLF